MGQIAISACTPRRRPARDQDRSPSKAIAGLYLEHQSIWGASHAHQMEALQTDEQITPITTIKRHTAAAGRVRHRLGPLKAAGVEVRSSPGTSTSTHNPRPTPGHPHSTRKSRYSPHRIEMKRFRYARSAIHATNTLHNRSANRVTCAHLSESKCARLSLRQHKLLPSLGSTSSRHRDNVIMRERIK